MPKEASKPLAPTGFSSFCQTGSLPACSPHLPLPFARRRQFVFNWMQVLGGTSIHDRQRRHFLLLHHRDTVSEKSGLVSNDMALQIAYSAPYSDSRRRKSTMEVSNNASVVCLFRD